jgi:hypothetical protein
MIGVVLGVVAALIVATLVSLSIGSRSAGRGCFSVYVPGPVGSEEVHRCGADARTTCASAGTSSAFSSEAGRLIAAECRKLRLPVGP